MRAGTGACPYGGGDGGGGDFDDSVNMIGHDNKLMDAKSIVINGDFMPWGVAQADRCNMKVYKHCNIQLISGQPLNYNHVVSGLILLAWNPFNLHFNGALYLAALFLFLHLYFK